MDSAQYKPRKKWPLVLAALVGLLVVVYFVATSGWFLKSVIVPQVASKLGSELTVGDASVSPFSQAELGNVKLTPIGGETLLSVATVRVRYGLMDILKGNIRVDEVTVEDAKVSIVEKLDGQGNLAKLLTSLNSNPSAKKTSEASAPPTVNVRNVALKNATLRYSKEVKPGIFEATEVTGLNLTLDQIGNGQTGKLALSLAAAMAQSTNRLSAKGDGSFNVTLDPKLLPSGIEGQLKLDVGLAEGAFKDLAGSGALLSVNLAATELKQLKVAFTRGGETLGNITLTGPYDVAKREARITYSIEGIDQRVLSLAGTPLGVGFGNTTVTANGRVDLAQFGQLVASFGKVNVNRFALVMTNGSTPALDLALDYKFNVNRVDKTALAEKVDIKVRQAGKDLVIGGLDRPMNLAWDRTAPGFREATFALGVTNLELADWRALVGSVVPAGRLALKAKVVADRDGRLLKMDLSGGVDGITGEVAGNKLNQLQVRFSAAGTLEDFVASTLERSELVVSDPSGQVAKLTLFANYHAQQNVFGAQASADLNLPRALKLHPVPGVELRDGSVLLSFQSTLRAGSTNFSAEISAAGLTGKLQGVELKSYDARVQAGGDLQFNTYTLQRLTLAAQTGTAGGGSFDLAGKFDPETKTGNFNFKSVGLNESALGPFLAAAIAPNRLVSASLDGEGSGTFDLNGESRLKGLLKLKNFVADDPAGKLPKTPLEIGFSVDAGQKAQTLDLRELKLELGATARAENALALSGKIDLATSNAAPSSLNIRSTGLDLTPLYELFAGSGTNAAAAPTTSAPAPAADPMKEPAAMNLPLQRFDLDLDIAKVFLREIAISNWVAKVRLESNQMTLEPLSLSLNGAPVRAAAKVNLGVPGYVYVVNFGATNIPVPPVAKSFMTGQRVDLHGVVNAAASIKGAGVTGPSLKRNLVGDIHFGAKGLDYQVDAVKSPMLKLLVSVLVTVLQLPGVTQSPIDAITANVTAGEGILRLSDTKVASPAFIAEAGGRIELADILTNSVLNLPISISLPKDGKFDKLPDFFTMKGTVGDPKKVIDGVALIALASRLPGGVGNLVSEGANKVGGALEKATGGLIPNLLGGNKDTNALAATNTNKPASALGTALGNLLGGGKNTNNAASTNQPQKGLLDLFKKQDKTEPKK